MNFPMPQKLGEILQSYVIEKNEIGLSSAEVYICKNEIETLYLKVEKEGGELSREYEVLKWANGKISVPKIRFFTEEQGYIYLLMTEMTGYMTCKCPEDELCEPYEYTVRLLAEGLLSLQSTDINDCPLNNILDIKLERVRCNIENNIVDMGNWEEHNNFKTPEDLYRYLDENRPTEDLCFTHGDYCLPNIFIDGEKVTGFIDMGRGGIADKWQDIALCVRSMEYNLRNAAGREKYVDMLYNHLGIEPDEEKLNYYILLDELF